MKGNLLMQSMLACAVLQAQVSYAGAFHAIIGPDGRPMVVQLPDQAAKPAAPPAVQNALPAAAQKERLPEPSAHLNPAQAQKIQQALKDLEFSSSRQKLQQKTQSVMLQPQAALAPSIKPLQAAGYSSALPAAVAGASKKTAAEPHAAQALQKAAVPAQQGKAAAESAEPEKKPQASFRVLPPELVQKRPEVPQPAQQSAEQRAGFSALGAEQYVNSEYLEDKEFNLEGKKRFYAMPEGVIDPKAGSTRMQMVEREKGVSKSVIASVFKTRQPAAQGPVTLSASYYRVSGEDAASSLGRQCFQGKKISKAKNLKLQSEVNLWPRAPLNDEFDFEIVRVEGPLKNIQISSYASKQHNPAFYWPFAVFLDRQGCVLEGAGGYKNNDAGPDYLYRERIEGVIQVPDKTEYILLTPLAAAIDVEQRALANYGQLKLIAIR
ncbi:putative pilus assembly protein FilE [Acinetobacter sp.]|uniref:putative pilus assembly protein FilE n=1 Tax=Acinetobacter sp. TaxID=472 RepID=UPI0035B2F1B2